MPDECDFEKLRCDTSGALVSPKKKSGAPNMRQLRRVRVRSPLAVQDRITDSHVGVLMDITTQGLRLMGPSPFPVNAVFPIKIILPEGRHHAGTAELDVRSVWCKMAGEKNTYHAGFKIQAISEKDLKAVEAIIEEERKSREVLTG
jgi:hypothetical protein